MQPDPHALAHLLRSTGRTSVEIANLLRERGHRISSSTVTSWMKVPGATTEPTRPRWYLLAPLADALNIPRATLFAACAGVTTNGFGPRSATRDEAIAAWNDRPRERELTAERDLLREQAAERERAFVVVLEAVYRKHDAEIAELTATLANERGEGDPPVEGWEWDSVDGCWVLGGNVSDVALVERWTSPNWTVATDADRSREVQYPTARAAMIAASAMVKP